MLGTFRIRAAPTSRCSTNAMQRGRLLQRGRPHGNPLLSCLTARPSTLTAARPEQLRCLASGSGGGGGEKKTWGELLSGAAELGSGVVQKIGTSVRDAAGSIFPTSKQQKHEAATPVQVVQEETPDVQMRAALRDAFGGGITGRIAGGLVGRAFGGMMKTMQQQTESARALQNEAAYAIKNDDEVQRQLGGSIQVGSPFSQQQSTMSVNGRVMQQVQIRMPVVGPRGTAEAVVEQSGDTRRVTVHVPGGGRIEVGSRRDAGLHGSGRVIDVDAEDVR